MYDCDIRTYYFDNASRIRVKKVKHFIEVKKKIN
jgi:hypothetical protein